MDAVLRIKLTVPKHLITAPLIYNVGQEFDVVTNIRRANVTPSGGWIIVVFRGEQEEIDNAVESLKQKGCGIEFLEN